MDKISVIIPCYNVEEYIDRCLKSVVSQTIGLERLEIITVNDASTDGTLEKLYDWERRFPDSIMVVTYEENLHLGGARNVGMSYATGEYIGFVDADDWIEPQMYELLYEKMNTGKYDLVKCKYMRDYGEGDCPLPADGRRDVEYRFTPRNGLYYMDVPDVGDCGVLSFVTVWSGLYKASMLRGNDIRFPEHLAFEDNYFTGILGLYVESLYILDVVLYHYFWHPKSITNARNARHHLDRMPVAEMLVEGYKRRGALEAWHDEIEREFLKIFFCVTWQAVFNQFDDIPDILDGMKETVLRLFPHYRENPYVMHDSGSFALLELLEADNLRPDELKEVKKAFLEYVGQLESAGQEEA